MELMLARLLYGTFLTDWAGQYGTLFPIRKTVICASFGKGMTHMFAGLSKAEVSQTTTIRSVENHHNKQDLISKHYRITATRTLLFGFKCLF